MNVQLNTDTFCNERGFKLLSWNIRSLYSKFNEFVAIIDKIQPLVICLWETWLTANLPDDWVAIDDYTLIRLDRCSKRKGGGVCIYVKNKYQCNSVKYNHLNSSNSDVELLGVEIILPSTTPLFVLNCYRPPSGNLDAAMNT